VAWTIPQRLRSLTGGPIGASLVASTGIQALSVFTGILLARTLGPEGRGELAAVILWPTILSAVGSLSVGQATSYHTARGAVPVGTITGTALGLALGQSLLLVALGGVLVPLVLSQYGGDTVTSALLYLSYIPLFFLWACAMAVLLGRQRFRAYYALRVASAVLSALGLLFLALVDKLDVRGAVLVYLIALLASGAITAFVLFTRESPRLAFDRGVARELVGYGLRSHLSTASTNLNQRLDQLVISVFLAPAKLGNYVVAVTLTSFTVLVGHSIGMSALPLVARHEPGRARTEAAGRLVRLTLVLSLLVTIPLLAFTSTLITVFFGEDFRSATDVCRVLLVGSVVYSTGRALDAVTKGIGRPLDGGIAELIGLVATVVGLATLLPAFGLIGAAITSLVAYLVATGWLARRAASRLGISARQLLTPKREDLRSLVQRARAG
jgi:O-antigen/teichoic acid export membrane protein